MTTIVLLFIGTIWWMLVPLFQAAADNVDGMRRRWYGQTQRWTACYGSDLGREKTPRSEWRPRSPCRRRLAVRGRGMSRTLPVCDAVGRQRVERLGTRRQHVPRRCRSALGRGVERSRRPTHDDSPGHSRRNWHTRRPVERERTWCRCQRCPV